MDSDAMLTTYLNDHLAGATVGVRLARRAAEAEKGTPRGPALARLAEDIAQDRGDLKATLRRLGGRPNPAKVVLGALGELAGRLKPNDALVRRSPLSTLVELEGLLIGVTGKRALWTALRSSGLGGSRLSAAELDRLIGRADDQIARIDALRETAAAEIFAPER